MKQIIFNAETKEQIIKDVPDIEIMFTPEEEIEMLKKKLSDTDYKAIKYAEGQLTEEEYGPIKQERQSWRNRINELELEQVQETEV